MPLVCPLDRVNPDVIIDQAPPCFGLFEIVRIAKFVKFPVAIRLDEVQYVIARLLESVVIGIPCLPVNLDDVFFGLFLFRSEPTCLESMYWDVFLHEPDFGLRRIRYIGKPVAIGGRLGLGAMEEIVDALQHHVFL